MKKILTTLLLAASTTFVFGQTLRVLDTLSKDITSTTYIVNITKGYGEPVLFGLKNTTNKKVKYLITRVYNKTGIVGKVCDNGLEIGFSFCTGSQCYPSFPDKQYTTPDTLVIGSLQTLPDPNIPSSYGITSDYGICEEACDELTVNYKIYPVGAASNDTTRITLKYSCSNGIKEEKLALGSLSEAYPNPTNNEFALSYKINTAAESEVVIFDVCGKRIQETKLVDKAGTVKISTSQFVPGIYFYSLIVNNQTVTTKKLIVQGL